MKLFLLTCLVACAGADVSHVVGKNADEKASIITQELNVSPEGDYKYGYDTSNGISASVQGRLINAGSENAAIVVQGAAGWTSPEGEAISLQYTADENGYQPQGSHIPTPPPIPEAILRGLEYIRAHPPPPEKQ